MMSTDKAILSHVDLAKLRPNGFQSLADASKMPSYALINVIAIVTDLMPLKTLYNGSQMLTIRISDPSLNDELQGSRGMRVRFFRNLNDAEERPFPDVRNIGDVAILKALRMQQVSGERVAIDGYRSSVLVFPESSIPKGDFALTYLGDSKQKLHVLGPSNAIASLTGDEQTYVIALRKSMEDVIAGMDRPIQETPSLKRQAEADAAPVEVKRNNTSRFGSKFSLVKDLKHYTFRDIVVEVIKKYCNSWGTCELYVTDYTENKDLWYYTPPEEETSYERDGDTFGYNAAPKKDWKGPYGFLVLKVNVKTPHEAYARENVKEGDIIVLKSVKMKVNSTSANARLEGDMWRDDSHPDRLNVSVQKDRGVTEVEQLLERREKYLESRRPLNQPPAAVDTKKEPLTKGQKKKLKRRKKLAREGNSTGKDVESVGDIDEDEAPLTRTISAKTNPHIRCSHEERSVTSLNVMLDSKGAFHTCNTNNGGQTFRLPFVLLRMRARVRVVDFEPRNMLDFAYDASNEDEDRSEDDTYHSRYDYAPSRRSSSSPQVWKWHWVMHLEDASNPAIKADERPRVKVQVQHEHAQFLLGNDMPDPKDLRRHPELLNKLSYKLSLLWGDLQECHETGNRPSNLPFDCCIQEYGIPVDEDDVETRQLYPFGWMPMYGLFGTTIVS